MTSIKICGGNAQYSSSWLENLLVNSSQSQQKIQNSKFAIVGILGDSNSGKSFLLNVLAEFLRREEDDDHKWIDDNLVKHLKGFVLHEQKDLKDNSSEGIYVWSRPFILKKPCSENLEESIVVLLLDISVNNFNPGLEVLMSLLCSTLIYNKSSSGPSEICEILKIRSEILKYKSQSQEIHPGDLVFQHLTVLFRDSKFRSGKDKSLEYLSKVIAKKGNIQWKDELEKIPNKSCFLLEEPFAESQEFDKKFLNQLREIAKNILNIDDLPLKALNDAEISLQEFITKRTFIDMYISDVAAGCTKTLYLETNMDEAMEEDDSGTLWLSSSHYTNCDEKEIEMEDLSQIPKAVCNNTIGTPPISLCEPTGDKRPKLRTNFHTNFGGEQNPITTNGNAPLKGMVTTQKNYTDLEIAFSSCLSENLKYYSEQMIDFFISKKQTSEGAQTRHKELIAEIIAEAHCKYFTGIKFDDKTKKDLFFALEKSCNQEYSRILSQKEVDKVLQCLYTFFVKNCLEFTKNGEFLTKDVVELFHELVEKAVLLEFPNLPNEYMQGLIANTKQSPKAEKCVAQIRNAKNFVSQLTKETEMAFEFYTFLSDGQFEALMHQTKLKITKDRIPDDFEKKIVNEIFTVIKTDCKNANKGVVKKEKSILLESVIPRITRFYNEEMMVVTQNIVSPSDLKSAHDNLKIECLEAVKRACKYDENQYCHLNSAFNKLYECLENEFELHKSSNGIRIEKCMAKVKSIVKKAHTYYIHDMNEELRKKVMSSSEIKHLHDSCFTTASIVLQNELALLEIKEDISYHINMLTIKTKHNFEFFVEENEKQINQRRIDEDEKLNAIPKKLQELRIAQKNLATKIQNEESNKNINGFKSLVPEQIKLPIPSTNKEIFEHHKTTANNKPSVLAVEFGKMVVKFGYIANGKFVTITDRWGDEEIGNKVAFTHSGEVLIGREISENRQIRHIYNVFAFLNTPLHEQCNMSRYTESLGSDHCEIRMEFLCGLILSRIKTDAEKFLDTTILSVVITVPLCSTTSQKQTMKNAGKIGGFSKIKLMTETTAVALAYAQQPLKKDVKTNFLVIVADNNSCHFIDSAIYCCDKGKVRMVKCAGNLHHKNTNSQNFISWAKKQFSWGDDVLKVGSILSECLEGLQISEYALLCNDSQERLNITKLLNDLCRSANSICEPPNRKLVVIGAAIYAKLWENDENSATSYISDLLPYNYILKEESPSSEPLIIFPRHERLSQTEIKSTINFTPSSYLKCYVNESGYVCGFPTSCLTFRPQSGHKMEKTVNFLINCDGIFRVQSNTEERNNIEFQCVSYSMDENAVAHYTSVISSMILLDKLKSHLQNLAQYILNSLEQVQSVLGKDQLERRACAAIEALKHPKVTKDDVSNRISMLTELRTKYFV